MLIKKRILTTIGALIAAIAFLLGAFAVPSIFTIRDLSSRIGDERSKLDSQYALRIFMRDAANKMAEVNVKLQSIAAMSIEEGGELAFITALEDAATANKVEQDIALETANQRDVSAWEREIPLTLAISGTYPNFLRHMAAIERLPYAISVSSVEVIPSRKLGANNPLTQKCAGIRQQRRTSFAVRPNRTKAPYGQKTSIEY
jgi:hypothetical protein